MTVTTLPTLIGDDDAQPEWITMRPGVFPAPLAPVDEVRVWADSEQLVAYLLDHPDAFLWWIDACWRHEPVRVTWRATAHDIEVCDEDGDRMFLLPQLPIADHG